jgi:hypothetical protein
MSAVPLFPPFGHGPKGTYTQILSLSVRRGATIYLPLTERY